MLFLVDLPAPVHGMSTINQALLTRLQSQNLSISVINTVPSYVANWFHSRWWLPAKILHTFLCLVQLIAYCITHPKDVVYRSVNGGTGQWFDLLYFSVCRLFFMQIYIHHHSFAYLHQHSKRYALINAIAGKKAVHIVLGDAMKQRLVELYDIPEENTRVQSNLACFDFKSDIQQPKQTESLVIGHLANLTFDKGLDTFLDVCYQLHRFGVPFEACIAGPATDQKVKQAIEKAINDIPSVRYIGPLYNEEKRQFYQRLDAFVFPTKYVNEAEPLVLYEAATHGALLIGTQRGCMPQVINKLGGHSFNEHQHLSHDIAQLLGTCLMNGDFSSNQRLGRTQQFESSKSQALNSLASLIGEFKNSYVSGS